jgi:hypothetical protein
MPLIPKDVYIEVFNDDGSFAAEAIVNNLYDLARYAKGREFRISTKKYAFTSKNRGPPGSRFKPGAIDARRKEPI